MRTARILAALLAAASLVAGCADDTTNTDDPAIANPASEHCIDNGGTLEMRDDGAGGQTGFCVFDDGSECEEWAYYREECAPGDEG